MTTKRSSLSRRMFLAGLTAGTAALAGCGVEAEDDLEHDDSLAEGIKPSDIEDTCGATAAAAPNLLIIHTDQQCRWTLGSYGGTLVKTPFIDTIARQGVVLDNFFTNGATCTPSRGCLLTGRYPHQHGAYRNNEPIKGNAVTLAHSLRAAGYKTGYAGKWHLTGKEGEGPGWRPENPLGFDDNTWMFNAGHYKELVEQGGGRPPKVSFKVGNQKTYPTDFLTTKAIEFLKAHKGERFFFMLSIPNPHDPFKVRAPYADRYHAGSMPLPATYPKNGKGAMVSPAQLREDKAQYCGMVKCIDDNVGRILAALDQLGLAENTVVVFMTDHADYMGEHGRMGKDHYYEEALHIPCIVRYPGRVPCGSRVERMISMVDLAPTLLGLMNVPNTGSPAGKSAAKLLQGLPDGTWSDDVHVHRYFQDKYTLNDFACLFTPDHELVVQKDDPPQLFLRADYPAVTNLYGRPEHAEIQHALESRMLAHHKQVGSPLHDWLKKKIPSKG
ncbi:MAG: sulfatase-like hydrolase/transferase [Minicystis sp.]